MIDFFVRMRAETYYIQVSYKIDDPSTREREMEAFKKLDDGYKKIIITMDDTPYKVLEKGYRILNLIDFLNYCQKHLIINWYRNFTESLSKRNQFIFSLNYLIFHLDVIKLNLLNQRG